MGSRQELTHERAAGLLDSISALAVPVTCPVPAWSDVAVRQLASMENTVPFDVNFCLPVRELESDKVKLTPFIVSVLRNTPATSIL